MNARYRKQMRLRSRHAMRGHTPWCHCLEIRQGIHLALIKWMQEDPFSWSGGALPHREG